MDLLNKFSQLLRFLQEQREYIAIKLMPNYKVTLVGTRQRKGQHGIDVEILTRIRKANKSTSGDFVLITQRGSAMCTCAAFFWNYL